MTTKTRKQKQEAAAQTSNSASSQNTGIQRSTSNSPRKWSRRKKRDKSESPQHPPKEPVQESSTISPESQAPAKKQHKNEDLQTMDTTSPPAKVSFNDQDHIETPPSIQRQVQPPEPQKDPNKFKAKRDMKLKKEPPNHYFYRVIAHTGIEPLKPFTKEDFLNPENDFDLTFLTSYFGDHPKYKDKFRNGELWLSNDEVKFIAENAVRAEKDPNNVFYPKGQPDMSEAARHATKDRALRVIARMCNTPYSEFPNWNEKTGTLAHPSFWEQYAAAAKRLLGCPGDLSGHDLKTHQAQVSKYAKQAKKDNPDITSVIENVYRTPRNRQQIRPARATNIQTGTRPGPHEARNETYVSFVMEQTPIFKQSDESARQKICAETFSVLVKTVFSRAPTAILQPDPRKTKVKPVSSDTPEDKYPDNTFNTKEIARDFYVSATGWPPRGTLRISHTGSSEDLLQALNQRSTDPEDPVIEFESHDIQSWRLSFPVFFLAATTRLDKDRWRSQAMKEPIVQQILKENPDFTMSLQSKLIQVHAREPYPKKDDRVYAWYVVCKPEHYGLVIKAIQHMYRSGRKTNFPGCQKVVPILNSADPLCKAENIQPTVARARLRQKQFLNHIMVFKIQGAIENIDAQVYPNGPTLEEQICGFHDPITLQRIFIGIDKSGIDEYTLTYHERNSRVAQETAHRLGIIMSQKFGVAGTVGFAPTYIEEQKEAFTHNPVTNRWESAEDRLQAESTKQMEGLDYWEAEDIENMEDDEEDRPCLITHIIMNPPGVFRTSTTVKMSDSITASTMAGMKADNVKQSAEDSFMGDPTPTLAPEPWKTASKYSSIWNVPGFPAPAPVSEQFQKCNGAHISEAFFLPGLLEAQLPNQCPQDFMDEFGEWASQYVDEDLCNRLGSANIPRYLCAIQTREDASPRDFFSKYRSCRYDQILLKHWAFSIKHGYPSSSLFGLQDPTGAELPVMALPTGPPATQHRKCCFDAFFRAPNIQSVQRMNDYKPMYLMAWAIYLVLDISPTDCHYRAFAGLFSQEISQEFVLQMQEWYIKYCRQTTANWIKDHPYAPQLMPSKVEYPDEEESPSDQPMEEEENQTDRETRCDMQAEATSTLHQVPEDESGSPQPSNRETTEAHMELSVPPLTRVPKLRSMQDQFREVMNQPPSDKDVTETTPLGDVFLKAYNTWKQTTPPDQMHPQNQRVILYTWAMEHIKYQTSPSINAEQLMAQWFTPYRGMTFEKLLAASSMNLSSQQLNHHLGISQSLSQPADFIHVPMTPMSATPEIASLEETLVKKGWAIGDSSHRLLLAQLIWWALQMTPTENHDAKLSSWLTQTHEQLHLTLFEALQTYFGPPTTYELEGDDL